MRLNIKRWFLFFSIILVAFVGMITLAVLQPGETAQASNGYELTGILRKNISEKGSERSYVTFVISSSDSPEFAIGDEVLAKVNDWRMMLLDEGQPIRLKCGSNFSWETPLDNCKLVIPKDKIEIPR